MTFPVHLRQEGAPVVQGVSVTPTAHALYFHFRQDERHVCVRFPLNERGVGITISDTHPTMPSLLGALLP